MADGPTRLVELRRDAIVDRWVLISPDRGRRPNEFQSERVVGAAGSQCPFCPGRESETPSELLAHRDPRSDSNAPGWRIRVVPNKFPAVIADPPRPSRGVSEPGIVSAAGDHEVIIETPEHDGDLSGYSDEQIFLFLRTVQSRVRHHRDRNEAACAILFRNQGARAGASLRHPHSQLITLPLVPRVLEDELAGVRRVTDETGDCPFCSIVAGSVAAEDVMIEAREHAVAVCPRAPRLPFETWVMPRDHLPTFEDASEIVIKSVGRLLRDAVAAIQDSIPTRAYNLLLHTRPFVRSDYSYHWHFEILPRITSIAGFEIASGWHINHVPPETAARTIRSRM